MTEQGDASGDAAAARDVTDAGPRPPALTDEELKALAHPLRVRMLEALAAEGPATASQLAARFGETSGATSYHLRQLDRHGFIEDEPDRGSARERWWRVRRRGWTLPGFDFRHREATRHHANVLLHEISRGRLERLVEWWEHFHEWERPWVDAAVDADGRLKLTRDELARLGEELLDVVMRYVELDESREAPVDAALVDVQVYAFPMRLLDDVEAEHDG